MRPRFKPRALVGRYRSKSEERFAGHLNDLGVAYEYEPKDKKVRYVVEASYLPDFILDGQAYILEVKGYLPSEDRSKYVWIKKSNPDIDIRFVFDRASTPITKNSKTTYAMWADKHGFKWCEKIIPPNWYRKTTNERASSKAAGTQGPSSSRKGQHLTYGSTARSRHLSACRKRA